MMQFLLLMEKRLVHDVLLEIVKVDFFFCLLYCLRVGSAAEVELFTIKIRMEIAISNVI